MRVPGAAGGPRVAERGMPRGSQPSARPVLTTGQSGRQGPKGTPSRDMSAREHLGKALSKPLQEISGNSGKKPPSPITPAKLRTSRGSTSRASMVIARDSMPGGDGAGPCPAAYCMRVACNLARPRCVRKRAKCSELPLCNVSMSVCVASRHLSSPHTFLRPLFSASQTVLETS